jgi:RNA polymerase sigma-70 factor (ECF subfamily)
VLDFRRESARMLAALTRILGLHNLALAEDVVQDVLCRAVELWKFHPLPEDPTAWLLRAARNRAIDLIRAERTRRRFAPDLALDSEWTLSPTVQAMFGESEIADDELRMMFSCCPPNVPPQAQLALVLKLLCGFGNGEVAAALLVSQPAVEKMIARGKRALVRAGSLYEVAGREQIAKRLDSVQRALYLLFSEGYHGSHEPVRAELCREAMRLCQLLSNHPASATPRTFALLALMCFHAARLPGRAAEDGSLLLLEEQDRSRWDRELIERGFALAGRSAEGDELSEYHLEAGIAAEHSAAASLRETNWERILQLYDLLYARRPSPVVALNRAIALGELRGPEQGLRALQELAGHERLAKYPFLPAAQGRLHLKAGRSAQAAECFNRALVLARNPSEARLFDAQLREATSAISRAGRGILGRAEDA